MTCLLKKNHKCEQELVIIYDALKNKVDENQQDIKTFRTAKIIKR